MSSLAIAVPCAVGAAIAYGASTAVQHAAAYTGSDDADARGLLSLVRNPRWLLGMAGDAFGLVLQVIALTTGPVALIQPILVLALPVSLPIAWWLGGPRPGLAQGRACLWMVAGLAVFFVLLGDPGGGSRLHRGAALLTFAVLAGAGLIALLAVHRSPRPLKAAVYGTVAGAWFGFVAVLMDATSIVVEQRGFAVLYHPRGFIPLVLLIVLGTASVTLTQASFQIGAIGASFPANLAADPVVAVALGAILLSQHVPSGPLYLLGYAACLGAVLFGAIRLADEHAPAPEPA